MKGKRNSNGYVKWALLSIVLVGFIAPQTALSAPPVAPGIMDPTTIPMYVNQLTAPPPVHVPVGYIGDAEYYQVDMSQFQQQVLPPGLPPTTVWGYGGLAKDALTGDFLGYIRNSPSATFEATRDVPIIVNWQNAITGPHMFAVDPTLHWANPNGIPMGSLTAPFPLFPPGFDGTATPLNPNAYDAQSNVPLIPHLHGGEVKSTFDGNPDAWFTANGDQGSAYNTLVPTTPDSAVFHYPNAQPATTLWYHDHALGVTRINVMSGLAGFYLLRDPADEAAPLLPSGQYEMPIVIQDRTFKQNGDFWFDDVGLDPSVHPYWQPEFFGNTIMVNGMVWPNMDVDQGQYRLRFLDGSNARFYNMKFKVQTDEDVNPLTFVQIGSDGGYLQAPVPLTELTIAPGERADVLVDFSGLPAGTRVILTNNAKTPYPNGAAANPQTTGQIMQFTVTDNPGHVAVPLPPVLNPYLPPGPFPSLPVPSKVRTLTLQEVMGPLGPTEVLLNGQKWGAPISELPVLGTTEEWVIANPTADTHPIHLHLVQFQLVSRQRFNAVKYNADWLALNGAPPFDFTPQELPVNGYLKGKASPANLNEMGWKDTVQMNPGEVTVIRVRFAPLDGSGAFPFDATEGPGYVWHCHILEHEDNEMMRPYIVVDE
jgi:spore coat protein A